MDDSTHDAGDTVGKLVGKAVGNRFAQLQARFPELPGDSLAAVAAYDVWCVIVETDGDPMQAIDEFLACEAALTA
jgi:hypothetical protein